MAKPKTAAPTGTKGVDTTKLATEYKSETSRMVEKIHPKAILIPGVDTKWDDSDPLCDERALKASRKETPHYDPALEAAYRANDPHLLPPPVVVTVDGRGRLIKVDGGRRLIHARFAGVDAVEYIVTDSTSPALLFMAVKRANIGRVNDSAIVQARDADRARKEFGLTLKEFTPCTGLTEEVLRQRLSLLFLCPELQALTELPADADGHLPFSVAIQLAKIAKPSKPDVETADAKATRFAQQLAVYKKLSSASNLNTKSVQREKKSANGAEGEETEEGAEGEGADDSAGTSEGRKGKKRGEASADAWTLKEIRAALKGFAEKGAAFTGMTPATIAVLKVLTGQAKAETVKGMKPAQDALRGDAPAETTPAAEGEATTETPAAPAKAPRAKKTPAAPATTETAPTTEAAPAAE